MRLVMRGPACKPNAGTKEGSGVFRNMRSKVVSETRFTGLALFAMAVATSVASLAYVALFNRGLAIPAMWACDILVAVAAAIAVAFLRMARSSSTTQRDRVLEGLCTRRDSVTVASLAVDIVVCQTLVAIMTDSAWRGSSILLAMSGSATVAGAVVMLASVATMVALIGGERDMSELRRSEATLGRGGAILPTQGYASVSTSHDIARADARAAGRTSAVATDAGPVMRPIPVPITDRSSAVARQAKEGPSPIAKTVHAGAARVASVAGDVATSARAGARVVRDHASSVAQAAIAHVRVLGDADFVDEEELTCGPRSCVRRAAFAVGPDFDDRTVPPFLVAAILSGGPRLR